MNVFTLSSPRPLEIAIAKKFDKKFQTNTAWRQFSNGEWFLRVARVSRKVLVLGRTEPPGDHSFQTLTLLDTLKRNGAKHITLVAPYFGYSRHDRVVQKGDHLPANLLIKLFKDAGVSRIITVDLHSSTTQQRAPIPLISANMIPGFVHAMKKILPRNESFTVVSPDHGSRHRANEFRNLLDAHAPVCWLEKHRDPRTGNVHTHELMGPKKGTTAVIIDDICDTSATLAACVKRLKKEGFTAFFLAVTHPVFSGNAIRTLRALKFKKIVVSNTVPLTRTACASLPIHVVDAAPSISRAIVTSRE